MVQRVSQARVEVDGQTVGQIGRGLLVLLGVGQHDTLEDAAYLARKIAGLRIFADAEGKMNLALADVGAGCWWSRSSPSMAIPAGATGPALWKQRRQQWAGACTSSFAIC